MLLLLSLSSPPSLSALLSVLPLLGVTIETIDGDESRLDGLEARLGELDGLNEGLEELEVLGEDIFLNLA